MITRPMLAAPIPDNKSLADVKWPGFCSPKLDGIRGLMHPELGPVTRKFIPVPNVVIRSELMHWMPEIVGLDGELMTVDEDGNLKDYNDLQGDITAHDRECNFEFHVFDDFTNPVLPYTERLLSAQRRIRDLPSSIGQKIKLVTHTPVITQEEFLIYYEACVAQGYEGAMIRSLNGPYKSNRSTFKEGWLIKYKGLMEDGEGIIIGFEELQRNTAGADPLNPFGLTHRRKRVATQMPGGMMGKMLVYTLEWGVIKLGTGFTLADRIEMWANQEHYIGKKFAKYRFQRHGTKEKPRFPAFHGFRDPSDMEQGLVLALMSGAKNVGRIHL